MVPTFFACFHKGEDAAVLTAVLSCPFFKVKEARSPAGFFRFEKKVAEYALQGVGVAQQGNG